MIPETLTVADLTGQGVTVIQSVAAHKTLNIQRSPGDLPQVVCEWSDGHQGAEKRRCATVFGTVRELVSHVAVQHLGGADRAEHIRYWESWYRGEKTLLNKYKLIRVHTGEKTFLTNIPWF